MTTAERLRNDFFQRLDEALDQVPHGVAREIRAGIAEELEGLDAATTAARIDQLGDPADIARAAQESVAGETAAPVAVPVAAPVVPITATRGFATVAALTLGFGGIVLPVAGWFIGVVLVGLSSIWRTWEQVVAVFVPVAVAALLALAGSITWTVGGAVTEPATPLMPFGYDLIWTGIAVLGILLIPLSGIWLLWRLRGRPAAS